jgi:hypothetical protein
MDYIAAARYAPNNRGEIPQCLTKISAVAEDDGPVSRNNVTGCLGMKAP